MSEARKHVLIAGGSAFLGAHLVSALHESEPDTAISVMDLRPYEGPHSADVAWLRADITNAADCDRALSGSRFDAVVSMVSPDVIEGTAEAFERVNVGGVRNLVEACAKHGVAALVFVSSIAVTDHFREHVDVDEAYELPPLETYRSPYDRSKRLGEEAVLAADGAGGLRTCALRMGGILSDMRDVCLRFLLMPVIMIQGRGEPIDMLYGGDAARAIVLAIKGLLERPDEVGGQIFFITKGRATTNEEYFRWGAELLGRRLYVMPKAVRVLVLGAVWVQHHVRRSVGARVPGIPLYDFMRIQSYRQTFDNSKAERVLGYRPSCTLREGLEQIVRAHLERSGECGGARSSELSATRQG